MASTADMNSGFSRELFIQWAPDPKNTVIFTYCTAPGSLARHLIDNPDTKSIEMDVCSFPFFILFVVGFFFNLKKK